MCGILGCYHSKKYKFSDKDFISITDQLIHRGPNDKGYSEFIFENDILKLGHRRLSILDLKKTGSQPMKSSNNRFTIIYNGEIYNHIQLRNDIKNTYNHEWNGTSDTETLLSLFNYKDIEAILNSLEGMFAFVIYDKIKNTITLARDRAGEKPLYIYSNDNLLYFSSDLNSLKKFPNIKLNLNNLAINKYLEYNYIPHPLSIFKSCFKLPPGTFITIDLNNFRYNNFNSFDDFQNAKGVSFKTWWSLEKSYDDKYTSHHDNIDDVTLKTESIIEKSIHNQLISDVPLGAFLSGGIDSSLIVSLMKKNISNTETFTVGFNFDEFDESKHALKIANHLKTKHTTYECTKDDVIDNISEMPKIFSEPFADSSQIPTYLVSKMAKKNVTVALSGDGGDEIFGGYNRYLLANKYWKFIDFFPLELRKIISNILINLPKKYYSPLINLTPLKKDLSGSLDDRIEKMLIKLKKIEDKFTFYESMTKEWTHDSLITNFENNNSNKISDLFKKDSKLSFEEAMMHADFQTYLTDDILCKVDRCSMFSSLETRAPYLSKDVIEYAYSLPLRFKIYKGQSKWILKRILSKYLPENIYNRPKQGFGLPISKWMKNDLKDWVNDILSKEINDKHNLFNNDIIIKTKNEHFKGLSNHEHKLWSLIQFNLWYLDNKESINFS